MQMPLRGRYTRAPVEASAFSLSMRSFKCYTASMLPNPFEKQLPEFKDTEPFLLARITRGFLMMSQM